MTIAKMFLSASLAMMAVGPVAAEPPTTETAAPAKPVDPRAPEAVRCRQIEITGSLARRERVCKTNAEWARLADSGNRNARAIVDSGAICAGGSCRGN